MPVATTTSPEQTRAVGAELARHLRVGDVLVLGGDLGAGKTCLTQGIARALGVDEPVTSPTFTLVNRYDTGRLLVHHLDVYRIDDLEETLDLDLPELLDSGVTVIEWGEQIAPVLPVDHLLVRLEHPPNASIAADGDDEWATDDHRRISLVPSGTAWTERVAEIDLTAWAGSDAS